ncbi:uncharacterized protein FIBRA_07591 [Fibroporia radiculosa]|uniref:F-box domain-containing protein n=1 Tax=Fibroporia radiculosa TaxID=599839 RepID=J4GVA1_9APHY|nr:uncharacterized protein FIBRA_07591 [Fibroporia radiculosa]CCM05375.1 predicted protein [Fibroporia radiculosa]
MDKFSTLEPVRLYATSGSADAAVGTRLYQRNSQRLPKQPDRAVFQLIGHLPVDVHILILTHLAICDLPAYALTCRALATLVNDARVWEARWNAFRIEEHNLEDVLSSIEEKMKAQNAALQGQAPPTLAVDIVDDDFGEFADVGAQPGELGDFVGVFEGTSITSPRSPVYTAVSLNASHRTPYIRAHRLLKSFVPALSVAPHAVLSALFPVPSPPLRQQAHILRLLSIFLSPRVKPLRKWETLSASLKAAIDRFEDGLLTAFDIADSQGNESDMKEAAEASWDVWDRLKGDTWELGRLWAEKREIFYEQSKWKPLDNFTADGRLFFDAMDSFMSGVIDALREHGPRAIRVFPPKTNVLLTFADRLATDVVGEYISPLLTRAREIGNEIFLKATAASFNEAWRMVNTVVQIAHSRSDSNISRAQAEDVLYRMFEPNMDEYLDEEVEFVKLRFETICQRWESQLSRRTSTGTAAPDHVRFLGSQNPAQVKRTVLASFADVLLLPVAIVPRTFGKAVGAAFTTGSTAAVQGISMLNPQRWGGNGMNGISHSSRGFGRLGVQAEDENEKSWYSQKFSKGGDETIFEIGDLEADSEDGEKNTPSERSFVPSTVSSPAPGDAPVVDTLPASNALTTSPEYQQLDLLLSLDVALELIHADRESLKRAETFSDYPGQYGHRVRDTIEEIFVLLLQTLTDRHIRSGFESATQRMKSYRPAEHEESRSVAPLLQFFELVHIGDTIQSMVQVYFDKELAPHIDRTDFLNSVVREKKRFEDALDDCVAAGLNAGTDALMNQIEHIIVKLTKLREYYPPEDAPMELGPTQGCMEVIQCLKMHCQLLKGSTSKEVLEVFYQEIGIRLIAILQKHLKRQIISLNGGFQVIADLNAYHSFISTLKVSNITAEFSYLKMLGHVFIVEDAKDLAQIVRDVTRYGGAYRPEDVYEFIQRRADWKKIEKTVDKTMYNLSFKDDCTVC